MSCAERYLLKRRQLESVMECLVSKRLLQQLNDTLNYTTHKNYKTDEGSVNENKRFVDEKNNFDKDKNANQRNGEIKEEVDVISNKTQDYTTSSISSDIDSTKLKAVLKQIINSYLLSISKELSRIYEYQLSLISDGLGLDMASRYAADCIGDFLHFSGSSVPIFHVDSAVHSVVWRSNKRSKLGRSTLSVLIGEKELKWKIEEIFYKPGLRLDGLLYSKKNELTSPKGPFWRFFCHYGSDCLLYGYRGAVIDRFPRPDLYRVHRNELCFDTEVDWVEEDFHRCYVPYRKVVGWGVVQMYKKVTETKIPVNTSFTFSTPKRDSHSKPHDAVEGMPTSESDQILSFNSFVSILLGDEAAKEDMEVVCRYLQNEQTIRAHFNHLRSNELNTNNNNNNTDGENDDVVPQDDISEKTRNDDSFNVNELNYTGQQPSFVISEQKPFEPSLPNCDTNTPLMLCSEAEDSTSCPKISLNNASSDESKNSKKKDVKNLIKYSLTPVKSQKMVDPASFIPLKHLGSLELDDLYTQSESYSTEDLTENTSTASACFPCDGVSQKACQDNEPFSKHDRSSDQSLGGLGPRCATEALKEEVDVSKITQNTTKSSLASEV